MFRISILLVVLAAIPSAAQIDEGLKSINGTQLYVKSIGKGETIVVVHGGPGMNHSYLIPHLKKLSKDFRVIYYDQRASGLSAIPDVASISLDSFVEDIEAIRVYSGKEKIFLLAHSWGIIPAVNYGIKYPDRVKGIIFCNAIPLSKEYDEEMMHTQLARTTGADSTDRSIIIGSPNFKAGKPSAYKKLLMLSFRNSFYKLANFNHLSFDMPNNYIEASKALFTGLGKDLAQYDYYEAVSRFSFPMLLLHGSYDVVPMRAVQRLADQPNATLEVFKKSGHFIFIEENKKFNAEVRRFADRN